RRDRHHAVLGLGLDRAGRSRLVGDRDDLGVKRRPTLGRRDHAADAVILIFVWELGDERLGHRDGACALLVARQLVDDVETREAEVVGVGRNGCRGILRRRGRGDREGDRREEGGAEDRSGEAHAPTLRMQAAQPESRCASMSSASSSSTTWSELTLPFRYAWRATMCAEIGAEASWISTTGTRKATTAHVCSASATPTEITSMPSTCGFVAACRREGTSGKRSRPIAAVRQRTAPTSTSTSATISIVMTHPPAAAVRDLGGRQSALRRPCRGCRWPQS